MWDLISPPKIFGAVCAQQRRHEDTPPPPPPLPPGGRERAERRSGSYLLGELDDQRQLVGLDKTQKALLGHLAVKRVAAFIELRLDTNIKSARNKIRQRRAVPVRRCENKRERAVKQVDFYFYCSYK